MRDIIRDFMSDEFDKHGTTEFTTSEITRGLKATGHAVTNTQVSNGLQSLKALNKAVQTRKVPGVAGGAMYWTLVKVLEAATEPETNKANKARKAEQKEQVEMPQSNGERKPRHDDPAHIEHVVAKHVANLNEALVAQVGQMLGDLEKVLKTAIGNVASAPTATSFDWGELDSRLAKAARQVYTDAVNRTTDQHVMSIADIGAKLSEENTGHMHQVISIARAFTDSYDRTTAMMRDLLVKSVSDDDLKQEGFAKGFAAGWAASENRLRDEIEHALKQRPTTLGLIFDGNKPDDERTEMSKQQSIPDTPLHETLKRLGG
jgi:hypothetical protein